jgi:hypothetical protein
LKSPVATALCDKTGKVNDQNTLPKWFVFLKPDVAQAFAV